MLRLIAGYTFESSKSRPSALVQLDLFNRKKIHKRRRANLAEAKHSDSDNLIEQITMAMSQKCGALSTACSHNKSADFHLKKNTKIVTE